MRLSALLLPLPLRKLFLLGFSGYGDGNRPAGAFEVLSCLACRLLGAAVPLALPLRRLARLADTIAIVCVRRGVVVVVVVEQIKCTQAHDFSVNLGGRLGGVSKGSWGGLEVFRPVTILLELASKDSDINFRRHRSA